MTETYTPRNISSQTDIDRLRFLIERDSMAAAREFASRTLRQYRAVVVRRADPAKSPVYRRRFVLAYLQLRDFLAVCPGAPA
jgi:hypothetical protein